MQTKQPESPAQQDKTPDNGALADAIRRYVRAYALWHGRPQAARRFGVSRHTLWRFLERGHLGRSLPRAVAGAVGDNPQAIDAATDELAATALQERKLLRELGDALAQLEKRGSAKHQLTENLEDALLLLCAAPLATVKELSRFGRVPESTLRDQLNRLEAKGLADSVSHRLPDLGPRPQLRFFPTEAGIIAAGKAEHGTERFLSEYPVSRQWFRILAERLDAVAVVYHVAALLADADQSGQPVRVDHYRQGPYDALVTLSEGRTLGIIRQGPTLPSPNLRYRFRTAENLPYRQQPTATLVLVCSDQANRRAVRAVRTLGHPMVHRTFFVATEGEQLAGDHQAAAWQQCGNGMADVVTVAPEMSLSDILAYVQWYLDGYAADFRDKTPRDKRQPKPDPGTLYSDQLRALMPDPMEQVKNCLAVQLTGAQKQALDLLAAWPRCTTEQFTGLMGGVTRRWARQVIQSLSGLSLVQDEHGRHVLTDDGLRCLARRDRLAVRMALGRWSARQRRRSRGGPPGSTPEPPCAPWHPNRTTRTPSPPAPQCSPPRPLNPGTTSCWRCCPPPAPPSATISRASTTWSTPTPPSGWPTGANGALTSSKWSGRAVTPKRARQRLRNYRRYFASNWAKRDHGGTLPLVLFVFETPEIAEAFVDAAGHHRLPLFTSDLELFEERGVLGEVWRPPPPEPYQRLTIHCLDKLRLCP